MDRSFIQTGIHNFFVSLVLIPIILWKFIAAWSSINSTVKNASKTFSQKMLKTGLPEETVTRFTMEYTSIKDYIFEGFLKRKDQLHKKETGKDHGIRNIFIKMLPGGQILLRMKIGRTEDMKSAVVLDLTKTVILIVAVARALVKDVYWVTACVTSYVSYSVLFGLASELITKHRRKSKGLLGSVVTTVGEALSDTKVIAIVSLALSSHAILAAPSVPLYHVIPYLDFVEHYISGFGIGLLAAKTYRIFVSYVSYNKASTIIGSAESSHQISLFETSAELPFVCYSSILVGFGWEMLEEIVENFTPRVVNVFFWNGVADIFMDLLGALTAYLLVSHSFIIKKQENKKNLNAKIDLHTVRKVSDEVVTHMKDALDNVYSEGTIEDILEAIRVNQLTGTNKKEKSRSASIRNHENPA